MLHPVTNEQCKLPFGKRRTAPAFSKDPPAVQRGGPHPRKCQNHILSADGSRKGNLVQAKRQLLLISCAANRNSHMWLAMAGLMHKPRFLEWLRSRLQFVLLHKGNIANF